MAKTKTKAFTEEELLAQALVPEDEQLYELPENWVWTRLGNIARIIGGGTPPTDVSEYYKDGVIAWISPADLSNYESMYISHGKKNITVLGLEKSSARLMPKNTVLLSSRAPIGYVVIAQNELCTNQGFKSFLPSAAYVPEYLYFYLKYIKETLVSYASGTTFLELSGSKAAIVELPLPPIAEQHRIVERIERLFEKLDRVKEMLQNARDSFETRKAAILHKAFAGELTAKWREKNGVSMVSWEEKPLYELCDSFQYGTSKKSETSGNVVVIRMGNLQNGLIDWSDLAYTNDEEDINKYTLSNGDVLFNRTNSPELVGKTSIYRGEMPAIFAGYLIRINYRDYLDGSYLNYIMNSKRAKEYCTAVKSDGVNQSNINAKKLAAFKIPYCSIKEQQEIVRILDNLFEKDRRAHELCNVIDKITLMKKSILARAFRGELGTNDPTEDSSLGLLKDEIQKVGVNEP